MRPSLFLLTLTLVALQVAGQDPADGAAEVPQPAADGAVNTRAGPQSAATGGAAAAGGQDLRFSPALIGSVLQAGSALINSALTGGAGGHQHHHGGNFGQGGNQPGFNQFGHGGNQPGFNQFGHGGFGASNFGGGGFGGRRPHRPGRRPGFGHQGGFGHHGHQGFGGHQGGFGHQGNFGHQGGFGQGGFGHQGNFGQGNFGDEKGGSCPPVRAECPLRSFGPPNPCLNDFGCPASDKCCFDVCLKEKVCKPPQ